MPSRNILLAEETLFRDDTIFNPDYTPDQFRFRDTQMKEMGYALRPAFREGRPSNAFLIGPPATGKTTAVGLVFEELAKETNKVLTVHVNCHMHQSAYKIFSEIHKRVIGRSPPETGVPLSKVREDVFSRLARDGKILVVALDDINYLFENNTANDVLYTILRAHESYRGVLTAVFAVSTEKLLHALDDRVRSIFSPVRIEFPQYSAQEIVDILKVRVDAGLYPNVMPVDLLQRIVSHSRDLRFGIELIKQSAIVAEADASPHVDGKHLEKALKAMTAYGDEDNRTRLIFLVRSMGPTESGDLYTAFNEGRDVSYTTFYRVLQKLKAEGTIEIKPVSKARGKTSLISAKGAK